MFAPLDGSQIEITERDAEHIITIPYGARGLAHYLLALFLIFWLVGWAFGWMAAFGRVSSGSGAGFLTAWLCAWTLGGVYASYILWRLLRPAVPETLVLQTNAIRYDSGVEPLRLHLGYQSAERLKMLFRRRLTITIDRQQLRSLTLRAVEGGNRLTVDAGVKRIDIARGATEIEREWLHRELTTHYS